MNKISEKIYPCEGELLMIKVILTISLVMQELMA